MALNHSPTPDYSILAAFNQPIRQPKTGFFYLVCLLLVAGTMLILPLIYLSFVGGLIWAVYYHAVYNWSAIMHLGGFTGGGRILVVKFFIYILPLLAGLVVIFFMFKPLLAGRPKRAQPLALNPAGNPLLYAFIAKISDAVGAPAPQRIDLDCELNASASFRRGFRSMTGNDMVLTLGLPLVANLTAGELAGVVAHEFGHFTQGAGMRLRYIIYSIIDWFGRVAYERDAWDEALEQWSHEVEDGRSAMVVWSVQLAVWCSRSILKLLMFAGHIVAGFLLRQSEYDADAYQIKVVGSETFEVTHRKLATLGAAMEGTYKQIRARWKKSGQLPDNLSELVRQMHESIPADILKKIDDQLGFHRTGLFDTHPSPADRIRRGRLAADPGIFHDGRPASALFASFEHPARFVTLLHYTDNLGIPITDQMLIRVESTQSRAAQGYAAPRDPVEDFFVGVLPLLLPLKITPPAPSHDREADLAELSQLATGLQQVGGQLAPIVAQYTDASKKLLQARAALRLMETGVALQAEPFGLAQASIESAQPAETEARTAREELQHSVHEVGAALNRRLQLALSLRLGDSGESGTAPVTPESIKELVDQLNRSADDYQNREEAMNSLTVWDHISAVRQSMGETPAMSRALDAQKALVNSFIMAPQAETNQVIAKPGLQLQLSKAPGHLGPHELEAFRQKTRQWFADYRKNVRQLAEIAQAAEQIAV